MGLLMNVNIALVATNLVLMTILLVVYSRLLREVRSTLTMGLMAFAFILWLQNAVQLFFFATMMMYYAGGVEGLVLVQNALATMAAIALLWASLFPAGFRRNQPEPAQIP